MTSDAERVVRALPSLARYAQYKATHTADLSTAGGELRGSNPWHGSSTGNNFAIDPNEGQWYCHSNGCKAGGGILEYIAVDEGFVECGDTGNLTAVFPEVLQTAAEIAGVNLDMDAQDKAQARQRRQKREAVDEVMEQVTAYYHQQLDVVLPHPSGDGVLTAREWLHEFYGLADATIDTAMVGFAPDADTALTAALSPDTKRLLEAGLMIDTQGGPKDFFTGRLVFPYFERGKPRYMIGRKTTLTPDVEWEKAKYKKLPTPDSKDHVADVVSEPIYGRDHARSADTVIVTEGVTDVLAARQHGYTAIAPVTTSFKESRVADVAELVRGSQVVVIMDEDEDTNAGIEGALKTARTLDEHTTRETDVRVARLPLDDGDLCDYLQQHGGDL